MKNKNIFYLWIIIAITVFSVIIVLPKTSPLHIKTPKIPGINKLIDFTIPIAGSTIGNREFSFRKGLDLAGGTSITLRADMQKIPSSQKDTALEAAKIVLSRRVNLFGVSEPTIQTAKVNNDYRIIVDLPGVNTAQAVSIIGTTAQLTFWEKGASGSGDLKNLANLPLGMIQVLGIDAKQTSLTGDDLKDAVVSFDSNTGKPEVQLNFTTDGTKKFADITSGNVGRVVAIVLDNQVVEAPVVREAIYAGNAVISGAFTSDQAKTLSIELKAGALPVPLSILEQHTVGATLGDISLKKSLFAGILGFIIIIAFMTALYKKLGMIASFALAVYTLIVLSIFKLTSVTLTLAGIAGLILSIGMAVDANILIFERIKEELRANRDFSSATQLGFSRAWPSIRDSNVSTLITCFILYQFGTGIVRGFALTLAIGVLTSMFSAIFVTRTFLKTFLRNA